MRSEIAGQLLPALIVLTVVFFILTAFIIYLVYLNQYKVRLMHLEKQMLQKTFEHDLLQSQMEIQETTLQRISGEIHDNVGQLLSIAKLTLSRVETSDPGNLRQLGSCNDLIARSLSELRMLAHSLQAGNLLQHGFAEALQNELDRLRQLQVYEIRFTVSGNPQNRRLCNELVGFRIFQELLTNIVRHAEATLIEITLIYEQDGAVLRVSDNGIGFEPELTIGKSSGIGLHNMIQRAKTIGGSLSFTQQPTTAVLTIPFETAATAEKE